MSEAVQFDNILTQEQYLKLIEQKIKSKDFKLLNYTIKPLSAEAKGYLGLHLIGKFDILLPNETTETVKFFFKVKLDDDSAESKFCTADNDVYIRESEFLKLATVKYHVEWAAQFYDFINGNVLVLEDLTERGFKLAELEEYDLNHCKVGLQTLANYHAFSFKYFHDRRQDNPDFSVLQEYPFFFKEVLFQKDTDIGKQWMESTRNTMLFMLDQIPQETISSEELKRKFLEKYDRLCDDLIPVENPYHIMSHGDLWTNNIMFSYENDLPQKCCLVDYQLLRYLPPAMDVQFFLTVNTSPSFRQKYNSELLDFYYEQLTNELNSVGLDSNEVYPKNVFTSTCKDTIILVLIMACCYKTLMLINREKMNEDLKDKEISHQILYGDRVEYIKIELENDANYKKKIFEEYQALIDEIMFL